MTDPPLTEHGERNPRPLAGRLEGLTFSKVFTSPLQRASRTFELAGFKADATVDQDLDEWNYGEYDVKTPGEIARQRPGWVLFRDGCPGSE